MARKNLFKGLEPKDDVVDPPAPHPEAARAPSHGALGALNMDLTGRSARMVQDIDPNLIESSGHRDRVDIEETDIEALARNISEYGQQVPVLVRPHPANKGHYQIVFGRRRLAAMRLLETPVKALVKPLSDEEAVLAQGQENSQRADPSFIDKALFATDLREADYKYGIILDALNTDKANLSRMEAVTATIPMEWIYAIGSAPDVGRRRWMAISKILAEDLRLPPLDDSIFAQATDSNGKFDIFEELVNSLQADAKRDVELSPDPSGQVARGQPAARKVSTPDGEQIGEIRRSGSALILKVLSKQHPEFGSWLENRAEDILQRLFGEWAEDKSRAVEDAPDD